MHAVLILRKTIYIVFIWLLILHSFHSIFVYDFFHVNYCLQQYFKKKKKDEKYVYFLLIFTFLLNCQLQTLGASYCWLLDFIILFYLLFILLILLIILSKKEFCENLEMVFLTFVESAKQKSFFLHYYLDIKFIFK